MSGFSEWIDQILSDLEKNHLKRSFRSMDSPSGIEIEFQNKKVLNFSSNDYLGLASEPFLKEAAHAAVEKWGTGSGAARLICGNLRIHEALEAETAKLKGTESALSFSSGFAVPMGVIPALVGKGDTVILDKLSHACLIDGARLSGAEVRVFPHQNLEYLEKLLKEAQGKTLIVTESVFSMDGDLASLKEIVELKEKYGAWLMVDEAHATGIFGNRGGGLIESLGLSSAVEVQMGTYSKALGSSGGYVAGSRRLIDFLLNKARSFVFSTANSPVTSAVSLAAIQWLQTKEGILRRNKLQKNIEVFAQKLSQIQKSDLFQNHSTPIFPWMIGDENEALKVSQQILDEGFLTVAIRYPTVPPQKARLRISLSAAHTEAQMDLLTQTMKRVGCV
ncbi:MAG: 8-amino-7-oxononanoate synthase [Verrucomicrobiota bacterium]